MANYDAEVRVSTKVDTSQMQKLQSQIDNAVNNVDRLTRYLEKLNNTKLPTERYVALSAQIKETQSRLERFQEKQKYLSDYGNEATPAYSRVTKQIADAESSLSAMRSEMQVLVDSGKAFQLDDEEIRKTTEELAKAKSELRSLVSKQDEMGKKNIKVSDGLRSISAGLKKIGSLGVRAFSGMNRHVNKSGGLLSGVAAKIKSMAMSLLVFNWITKGFNAMVSGMKDGFKNLVQYSDEYNRSISSLQSANLQLKNSFAAAFAPIVQMVIPYLVQLIGYVTSAVNAFAQFIAVLGGKTTWTRATKVQQNYAASLNGTAAAAKKATGALASFDEIEVLNKKDNSGSGGGINPGNMFEEVPVGKLSDFWKKLLDALKKGKWYELGKFLGEQLKKALDNIPWNEIKEKARNVGKNLADLINGFIEVEGLGYSIGRTLAEAFNTGFEFLNSFVHEFHFDSLGRFLAETFNGLFENIDWPLIKDTFVTGAKGLADLINNFDQYFHWDNISDTISNGLNTLAETIITFFETADWLDIGKNVGEQLIKSIEKTDWESVGRAIGDMLHSAVLFLAGALSKWDWSVISDALKDLVKGFFSAFDNDDLPENIKKIADAIELFGIAVAGIVVLEGLAGMVKNVKDFFKLFAGGTAATEIETTATAIGGLSTALGVLAGILAGEAIGKRLGAWLFPDMREEYENFKFLGDGGLLDQLFGNIDWYNFEEVKQNFKELGNAWKLMAEDIKQNPLGGIIASGFTNIGFDRLKEELDGVIEDVETKMTRLAEIVETAGRGVGTGADIAKDALDKWKTSTTELIDTFPQLADASAQTIADVTEGMSLINEGVVNNKDQLAALAEQSGYTNEALSFLSEYMTDNLSPAMDTNNESIMGNTMALQEEQTELTNTNTSLDTHQQVLENTNTKLKNTQTEMANTKNKSKEMADGINTNSNDVKKTTDSVWPQVGNKMKTEMLLAHDSICEMLESITEEINNVLAAIGALTKAGASAGASIGSSVLASVQSVQTQNYVQDIPHLATGSVIRGGNPFMAVLGDQKFGQTNIEAPLSTIEDAVRNVMADNSYSGGDATINLNYDGETFARLFLPDFFAEAHRQGYDFDFQPE